MLWILKNKNMSRNLTYGELTIQGCLDFVEIIKPLVNKDSVFVDIGSGYGKLIKFTAELLDIKSIGIEISKEKHEVILKKAAEEL